MKARPHRLAAALLALALLLPAPAPARPITSAEIVTETIAAIPSCMQWTVLGVCMWLKCTYAGCEILFSTKVGHYNPDVVISAYHRVGANPWVEAATAYGSFDRLASQGILSAVGAKVPVGGGDRTKDTLNLDHKDLIFKEADVIGHPAVEFEDLVSDSFSLICPSDASFFTPYLLSGLDATAWRLSLPEMVFPQALIPGLREIGHFPLNTWGPVYPRAGFVQQTHDVKAGAVCAQRAGDVVTRALQPHVYMPISATRESDSDIKVFPPGPLIETQCRTGWFQMLSPDPAAACEAFGKNDTAGASSWGDYHTDAAGDYAWTLWRPYRCCERKEGAYIGSIEIPWPNCQN